MRAAACQPLHPFQLLVFTAKRCAAFKGARDHLHTKRRVVALKNVEQRRPFRFDVVERHGHVANGRMPAKVHRLLDLLEALAEAFGVVEIIPHAVHGQRKTGLKKAAAGNFNLRVTVEFVSIQSHPIDRGIVGDDLVKRALPDDDWPFCRNSVERLAIDVAVPDFVEAPGDKRCAGIGHAGLDVLQPVQVGVVSTHRCCSPVRQSPLHRCNEMAGQQNSSK